jgi:iron complex transport system ATP-binding protein
MDDGRREAPHAARRPSHIAGDGSSLVVDSLTVHRGSRVVVDRLGFAAVAGAVTALIGPNGAGKSTALKAILGLLPAAAGSVRWNGEPVVAMERRRRARELAYVPQRSLLVAGMSVANVVATGRFAHQGALARLSAADHAAVEQALGLVDARDLAARRFDELSGGESHRVLLARALATGARCILLDEPTAGLDIGHALAALALLRRLAAEGRVVLAVLHHLEEVRRVADRVVLLHQGRTLASGTAGEVLAAAPLRAAFGVEPEAGAIGYRLAGSGP